MDKQSKNAKKKKNGTLSSFLDVPSYLLSDFFATTPANRATNNNAIKKTFIMVVPRQL